MDRFQRTSSVEDQTAEKYSRIGRSEENCELICGNVDEESKKFISQRLQKVDLVDSEHGIFYQSIYLLKHIRIE